MRVERASGKLINVFELKKKKKKKVFVLISDEEGVRAKLIS